MATTNGQVTLVIGGARSGKSRHAQALAERAAAERTAAERTAAEKAAAEKAAAGAGALVFVATAQAFDAEMTERIARHRADRDGRWRTVEAPVDLAGAIVASDHRSAVILVDCLTLWASNLLLGQEDAGSRLQALDDALASCRGRVMLVSNEVGWGIVPDNPLARRFRDLAGRINQSVAARADRVELVVAGLPMRVK